MLSACTSISTFTVGICAGRTPPFETACALSIDDCIIIEDTSSSKQLKIDLHPLAFERPRPKYTEEAILDILLDPNIDM